MRPAFEQRTSQQMYALLLHARHYLSLLLRWRSEALVEGRKSEVPNPYFLFDFFVNPVLVGVKVERFIDAVDEQQSAVGISSSEIGKGESEVNPSASDIQEGIVRSSEKASG